MQSGIPPFLRGRAMNVVLCTGVMRSGSTWSYNACRALVTIMAGMHGVEPVASYLEGEGLDQALAQDGFVGVFKAHRIGPLAIRRITDGVVRNVCTVRDPLDCVASRQRFKDESIEQSVALVRGSFQMLRHFGRETLFLDYRDIVHQPVATVLSIMRYLQCRSTDDSMLAAVLAEELSPEKMAARAPAEGEDATFALHADHVGSGEIGRWRRELADPGPISRALAQEIGLYHHLFGEPDENHQHCPGASTDERLGL